MTTQSSSSSISGLWFVDNIFLPIRDKYVEREWKKYMSFVTHRGIHPLEYRPFRRWWTSFRIGNQKMFQPYSSWPDIFLPFTLAMRLDGTKGHSFTYDPVSALGMPGACLDGSKYDLEQQAVALWGKYWRTLVFPEQIWRRFYPTQAQLHMEHAPPGLLNVRPPVEEIADYQPFEWRRPENRRWPPAHGHH